MIFVKKQLGKGYKPFRRSFGSGSISVSMEETEWGGRDELEIEEMKRMAWKRGVRRKRERSSPENREEFAGKEKSER